VVGAGALSPSLIYSIEPSPHFDRERHPDLPGAEGRIAPARRSAPRGQISPATCKRAFEPLKRGRSRALRFFKCKDHP